jgi:hypothetical protein
MSMLTSIRSYIYAKFNATTRKDNPGAPRCPQPLPEHLRPNMPIIYKTDFPPTLWP